jgi:hypothetical protein
LHSAATALRGALATPARDDAKRARQIATARASLGETEFQRAWSDAHAWTLRQAVDHAVEWARDEHEPA